MKNIENYYLIENKKSITKDENYANNRFFAIIKSTNNKE